MDVVGPEEDCGVEIESLAFELGGCRPQLAAGPLVVWVVDVPHRGFLDYGDSSLVSLSDDGDSVTKSVLFISGRHHDSVPGVGGVAVSIVQVLSGCVEASGDVEPVVVAANVIGEAGSISDPCIKDSIDPFVEVSSPVGSY